MPMGESSSHSLLGIIQVGLVFKRKRLHRVNPCVGTRQESKVRHMFARNHPPATYVIHSSKGGKFSSGKWALSSMVKTRRSRSYKTNDQDVRPEKYWTEGTCCERG